MRPHGHESRGFDFAMGSFDDAGATKGAGDGFGDLKFHLTNYNIY